MASEVAFLRAELARVTMERDQAREELTQIKTVEIQKLREQIEKLRGMKDKFLAEVLEMKKTMVRKFQVLNSPNRFWFLMMSMFTYFFSPVDLATAAKRLSDYEWLIH